MADPKRIDIAEFRRLGILQEANRLFFHPLGLALEVLKEEDGSECLGGVWDYREDPEGMTYAFPDTEEYRRLFVENADRVSALRDQHAAARIEKFGDVVQPLAACVVQPRSRQWR